MAIERRSLGVRCLSVLVGLHEKPAGMEQLYRQLIRAAF